jgi:phage shock protein E
MVASARGHMVLDRRFVLAPGDDPSKIERIDPAAAAKRIRSGSAYLVDVRTKIRFDAERAAGAVNVPLFEVAQRATSLSRDKTPILYCTCPEEDAAAREGLQLQKLGFPHPLALRGGLDAWKKSGLPLDRASRG